MFQVAFVGRAVTDPEIREKEEKSQAAFRVAIYRNCHKTMYITVKCYLQNDREGCRW